MSTQRLPAASLRTGIRIPAAGVLLWVLKQLIWRALSSIGWSICGAQSNFLPAVRDGGRSARVVGVLALAQHHADRGAGQIELLAQPVDEIAPIRIREVCGFRSEECEGRRAGVDLR